MAVKKRTVIIIALLVFVVAIAALCVPVWFYISDKVTHLDSYKELITKTATEKLNRSLTYGTGKASLTLTDGLTVQFTDVIIKEKNSSSDFLNVKNAFLRVSFPLNAGHTVHNDAVLGHGGIPATVPSAYGLALVVDLAVGTHEQITPVGAHLQAAVNWPPLPIAGTCLLHEKV